MSVEQQPTGEKRSEFSQAGIKAEASIISEDKRQPEVFIEEGLRQELRKKLVETGVDFSAFNEGTAKWKEEVTTFEEADGKSTISSQTMFVLSAISPERLKEMIGLVVEYGNQQPGSKIVKKSDRDAEGFVEPTNEMIRNYSDKYFDMQMAKKRPLFAPKGQTEDVSWGENVVVRHEAVISATYVLLRTLSYESAEEALQYQKSRSASRFLRERIVEGHIKHGNAIKMVIPAEILRREPTKTVRLLPAWSLGVIMDSLVK